MNIGTLGEAKALTWFVENDYVVFTQFDGKAPFDLVAYKDDKLYRVSVKSTSSKDSSSSSWIVELKSTRHNRTKAVRNLFDNSSCDFLAVYIQPEDRLVILKASDIKAKCNLSIKKEGAEHRASKRV